VHAFGSNKFSFLSPILTKKTDTHIHIYMTTLFLFFLTFEAMLITERHCHRKRWIQQGIKSKSARKQWRIGSTYEFIL